MSVFRPRELKCPMCGTPVPFDTVHSVNADRRPDLCLAILARTFQSRECPACRHTFRLDPEFNYLHVARGQWIAAFAVTMLGDWAQHEAAARALFDRAYGESAADAARALAAQLKPRITFGWPALREKLLIAQHGLDDIAIEGCKASAMRGLEELPFSAEADLRLVVVQPERLVLAWQDNADGDLGEVLAVPRTLHDDIAADSAGDWASFRAGFAGALFVDLARAMVPAS